MYSVPFATLPRLAWKLAAPFTCQLVAVVPDVYTYRDMKQTSRAQSHAEGEHLIYNSVVIQPDTAMHTCHVIVARPVAVKHRHADPADVRLASAARHMVAALCLLHGRCAFWTVFDIEVPLELC